MFKKLFTLSGAIATAFYPGFAYSACEFKETTDLNYQLAIESIEDYQEHTVDFAEGARKCIVTFKVQVNKQWYVASGDYVYGSKISDSEGCSIASERAKQDILRVVSPEVLTGSKELVCYNEVNNTKKDPTVDLFSKLSDNKDSDNNTCKRVYHEVILDNSVGQIWECANE